MLVRVSAIVSKYGRKRSLSQDSTSVHFEGIEVSEEEDNDEEVPLSLLSVQYMSPVSATLVMGIMMSFP